VTEGINPLLDEGQLRALGEALHQGAAEASGALVKWIGRPSVVEVDSLEQLPLEEAAGLLSAGEQPICFCATQTHGLLTGEMILAFDDASGLALADMVQGQPRGTTREWTDMAISAALETANILSCAYLNSLSRSLSKSGELSELLPSPPTFSRDFPESLMESALMGQAVASDQVVLARTRFEIDATPVNWTLLFVPDAPCKSRLPGLFAVNTARR
jgi:chemotaxis protein CheC